MEVRNAAPAPLAPPLPAASSAAPARGAGGARGLPLLLAGLSAIGPFSIDAYLPSFREIGEHFSVAPALVQQTLTAYFVPFAIMTLWHGVMSDAFGRRRVTLVLLAAFALASFGCLCAWSIESLLVFRALQGMSAGAGVVIGRAIVRDLHDGPEARKLMSRIATVFAVAPAVAPVVGGWLHTWFGWRSVFAFLVLFAALLWELCRRHLPETLPVAARQPLDARAVLRGYGRAFGSPPFMTLAVALALSFGAVFLYIASAPAFVIDILGRSETSFLWLFGPVTAGLLLGARAASFAAGRWGNRGTLATAYAVMGVAVVANLALHVWRPAGLPWSVLPLALYVVGCALASPSLTVMALDLMPQNRGLASSCMGCLQTASNALVTAALAPVFWTSGRNLALGMALIFATGGGAFAGYLWVMRARSAIARGGFTEDTRV